MLTAFRWLIAGSVALLTTGCTGGGSDIGGPPMGGGAAPEAMDGSTTTPDMTFATTDAGGHADTGTPSTQADAAPGDATPAEAAADAGPPLAEAGPPACLLRNADCSSCRDQYCSTVTSVCTGEPACNGAFNIFLACSCDAESHNDMAALAGCEATFSGQSAEASGVSNCVSTACKNECGF